MVRQVPPPNSHGFPAAVPILAACFGLLGVLPGTLGITWLTRISNHDGVDLVTVQDAVTVPLPPPRQTLVVLVDGLGLEPALQTPAATWLKLHGRCFAVTHETPTMSRPVYAVVSTGLPQSRTGVRANGVHTPARAQSVWELMTAAGLTVSVWSDVSWWQELFPKGFTTVRDTAEPPGAFQTRVALVHPTLVDHAGHHTGGDSHAYAEAVRESSTITLAMLQRLDLQQDVALVTADHGHWHSGGHGGDEPRINRVLACAVGRGVTPSQELTEVPGITLGPLLTVFMGLPFPSTMQAPNAALRSTVSSLDGTAFPPGYLEARLRALDAFDDAGRARLAALGASSWADVTAHGQAAHATRWWVAAVLAWLALVLAVRVFGGRHGNRVTAWATVLVPLTPALLWAWRGTFSMSVINTRPMFLASSVVLCGTACAVATLMLWWWTRQLRALVAGQAGVCAAVVALAVAHVMIHGWTPGLVLPDAARLFLPLWLAVVGGTHAVAGFLLVVGARWFPPPVN